MQAKYCDVPLRAKAQSKTNNLCIWQGYLALIAISLRVALPVMNQYPLSVGLLMIMIKANAITR